MTTDTVAAEEVSLIRASVIKTRAQLMFLTRDALEEQVKGRTQQVEGGAWDGVPVLTVKDWGEIVDAVFTPRLPPPDTMTAEVESPAYIAVSTHCPTCGIAQLIGVNLRAELVTDDDGSELKVKAKAKGAAHVCGQLPLADAVAEGQVAIDETIENLRVKILGAVADASDAWGNEVDPGPPPSLDIIARLLELPTENERADLEDSLYHLAGLETPLVEIVTYDKKTKTPTHYILTDAGIGVLEVARTFEDPAAPATDEDISEPDELP